MSFHKIEPILNNLADTLSNAAVALQSEHPVSVAQLIEMLTCTSQALRSVSPIIGELVNAEENQTSIIATARDYALELLFSLDDKQTAYKPRTHADNVELVHELLELVDGDEPIANESNNVVAVNFGGAR
jgi:hypothetical protein